MLPAWLRMALLASLAGCEDPPTRPDAVDAGEMDAGIGVAPDAAIRCANDWADAGPLPDPDPEPRFDDAPAQVRVSLTEANGAPYLDVRGLLRTSAVPQGEDLIESARSGSCRLLVWERVAWFCDPPCDADRLCGPEGACVELPAVLSAGPLTLTAGAEVRTVEPQNPGYPAYFAQWDGAPFVGLDLVGVSAAGDTFPPFDLTVDVLALDPPTLTDAEPLDGTDLVLRWACPDPRTRIRVNFTSASLHGSPAHSALECDLPDVGTVTVPAPLVSRFVAESDWRCEAGCNPHRLVRYVADRATVDGRAVELVVHRDSTFDLLPR